MKLGTDGTLDLVNDRQSLELKSKVQIVIVQEHDVLRDGLEILLEKHGEFCVIGSFDNLFEASAAIPKLQPDLVITDWEISGQPVTSFLAEIRRLAPLCKKLVLSGQESEECARAAIHAGAEGFVGLLADLSELTSAIRSVCAGRRFICNSTATRILTAHFANNHAVPAPSVAQTITGREREVLTRIALGNSNKAIARELGVSPKTVEKHRSNLMRKLQLHNAAAITMYAIRNGMTGGGDPFTSRQLAQLASGAN